MDPDEALRQLRGYIREVLDWDGQLPSAGVDLARTADALDRWLSGQGPLPRDWQRREGALNKE